VVNKLPMPAAAGTKDQERGVIAASESWHFGDSGEFSPARRTPHCKQIAIASV
jgi:hypothetical protein